MESIGHSSIIHSSFIDITQYIKNCLIQIQHLQLPRHFNGKLEKKSNTLSFSIIIITQIFHPHHSKKAKCIRSQISIPRVNQFCWTSRHTAIIHGCPYMSKTNQRFTLRFSQRFGRHDNQYVSVHDAMQWHGPPTYTIPQCLSSQHALTTSTKKHK